MRERLGFHMNFLKGREIVLWGDNLNGAEVAEVLKSMNIDFSFFISSDTICGDSFCDKPVRPRTVINRDSHYIIITTRFFKEIITELTELGYVEKIDYYKWYSPVLNYDLYIDDVLIGRNTYGYMAFSDLIGSNSTYNGIESIGRFTSINRTARMHYDHSIKMLSTGNLNFIDAQEADIYKKKYESLMCNHNKITIGNDVWIGASSFINASKVKTIGNGAVIGAGAIVVDDVPPYAVVVGVPAKIKKYRFTEKQIDILQRIRWWEWDESKLKQHAECFYNPELFFEKYI